jgi:hypothetical protein
MVPACHNPLFPSQFQNVEFLPIPALDENFNPQNTLCIHPKGTSCKALLLNFSSALTLAKMKRFGIGSV